MAYEIVAHTPREKVSIFVRCLILAAIRWAALFYGGLLLYAFLWDDENARDVYATMMAGKGINWVVFFALVNTWRIYSVESQPYRTYVSTPVATASLPIIPSARKYGGIYGKAHAAEDEEVDLALLGKTGGFDGMFED